MYNLLGLVIVKEKGNLKIDMGRLGEVWEDGGVGMGEIRGIREGRGKLGRELYRKLRKYMVNITRTTSNIFPKNWQNTQKHHRHWHQYQKYRQST